MELSNFKIKLILFLFVLLSIISLVLLFVTSSIPVNEIPKSIINTFIPPKVVESQYGNTKIEVISEIEKYNIESTSEQKQILVNSLDKLGFNSFKQLPFKGEVSETNLNIVKVTPSLVRIVLKPNNTLQKDKEEDIKLKEKHVYTLAIGDQEYANIFVGDFDSSNNTITIPLYVDLDKNFNIKTSPDLMLSNTILYSLFFNFQEKNYKEIIDMEVNVRNKTNLTIPFLRIIKKLSFIEKLNIIKEVKAQHYCGNITYQVAHVNQTCRFQRNACFGNSDCTAIYGDYCTSTTTCGPDTQTSQCLSNNANCSIVTFSNPGGCAFSGSCTFPTSPTPTPTPGPGTPTAPPASSAGGCGVGCSANWNCSGAGGAIPGGRAPICSGFGGGFCTDCTCDGSCDPGYSCSTISWCGAGISCGAGTRCQWNGSGGGTVRNANNNQVSWSDVGGWNCIPVDACRTCSLSLNPKPASVNSGLSVPLSAIITSQQNGSVNQVNFSSNNSSIASVNPTSDNTSPFTTEATGGSPGIATITATGYMNGVAKCSDTTTVSVTTTPWWQAVGGDVISNGAVSSLIPVQCTTPTCTPYLITDGTVGGFPGIVSYVTSYDFAIGSATGTASSKGWLVNSTSQQNKYSYASFSGLIPSTITINTIPAGTTPGTTLTSGGTQSSDGYYWYKVTGDLTLSSAATISGRKVILLVEGGDLTINANVDVSTPGNDFFMALVGKDGSGGKGNIIVSPTTTVIGGLFLADNSFRSGAGNTQLVVRGSMAANDYSLQRDLGSNNSATPAEVFRFLPAMLFAFPQSLLKSDINWQEVAP